MSKHIKLVYESLNELYKFEKKSDPLSSLGVGKKALIEKWLDEMKLSNSSHINDDYTINYAGSVDLWNKKLDKLPDYIQFNKVYGKFNIGKNNLTSLKGCPLFVAGFFACNNNQLKNLDFFPECVEGGCDVSRNPVKFNYKYVKSISKIKGAIYT